MTTHFATLVRDYAHVLWICDGGFKLRIGFGIGTQVSKK
jgi:hypothetical protein